MELATITAFSDTGFSDPEYKDSLPYSLAEAGITEELWKTFISGANEAVKFEWSLGTICCFLCNSHNKRVAMKLEEFCANGHSFSLPGGVQVLSKMVTEKQMASVGYGQGATLETFHKLIFTKK